MSQSKQSETTRTARKKKPLRRAKRWAREVPSMARKLFFLMVTIVVMGLMFSAMQAIENIWLRVVLSLAIISGMLLMCYNEGISKGMKDAGASRYYAKAQENGTALGEKEDAACYNVLKALAAVFCVFIVPAVLSGYIALTTKGYTYTLQNLPAWFTDSYSMRQDVMAPLGAYAQETSLTMLDLMRVFVRLPVMLFINLFSDPLIMTGTIDRLVPLFLLVYPLAFVVGYLVAPYANRKQEKMNRRAKKVAVRKAQKKTLAQTLVGDQHGVHYGQRTAAEKHKKKELV